MRKLTSTLTILAAVAAPVALAGCGTDDVDPAAIAQAAERTRSADTAEMRLKVVTKGFGLPLPLTVSGTGVTSLTEPELEMTMDLGPIVALAGAAAGTGAGGDGEVRVRVAGKDVAVDPPALEGFALPEGAEWLTLDLEKAIAAMGIDAAGLGEIMTIDPGAQLDVLRTADDVEELGTEEIGGAKTTHYRGTVRIEDFIERLPAKRRAAARKALDALEAQTETADDATPFEVWIDDADRIRRTVQRTAVPKQPGVPGGELTITVDLSGFGKAVLDPAGIPLEDTYDVTGDVIDALDASQK